MTFICFRIYFLWSKRHKVHLVHLSCTYKSIDSHVQGGGILVNIKKSYTILADWLLLRPRLSVSQCCHYVLGKSEQRSCDKKLIMPRAVKKWPWTENENPTTCWLLGRVRTWKLREGYTHINAIFDIFWQDWLAKIRKMEMEDVTKETFWVK